jgi:hypothetical protein
VAFSILHAALSAFIVEEFLGRNKKKEALGNLTSASATTST